LVKNPVFISYAREDTEFALRLAADLKNNAANVWLDQMDIRPGRQWDREIERALTKCNELLVILSPAAIDSNNVMDEVAFALEERKVVIPVLYKECRLPFRLRRLQYIDLKSDYEKGLTSLILALAEEAQITSDVNNDGSIAATETREDGLTIEPETKRAEQERLEREKVEAAKRAEQERLEREKVEAAKRAEQKRLEREKVEAVTNTDRYTIVIRVVSIILAVIVAILAVLLNLGYLRWPTG
jgi:asparagine synthetase B (glutamine-hydrolysing)